MSIMIVFSQLSICLCRHLWISVRVKSSDVGGEEDPLQTFLWINDLWCIEYMRQTQAYIKPSPAVIKKDTWIINMQVLTVWWEERGFSLLSLCGKREIKKLEYMKLVCTSLCFHQLCLNVEGGWMVCIGQVAVHNFPFVTHVHQYYTWQYSMHQQSVNCICLL